VSNSEPLYREAQMTPAQCDGAAIILCFLQDLFTISRKASFTPAEVVLIIDGIGKGELPEGLMDKVKDLGEMNDSGKQP
jgi:hypothetical protein